MLLVAITMANIGSAFTQESEGVSFVGALEHSGLFGMKDDAIGTGDYAYPYLSNSYLDLGLRSQCVSAGARVELNLMPLPGYEANFKGVGISNLFLKTEWKWGSVQVGDVYDQFGSGFVLNLYEDRPLGVDNSLRGAKLFMNPYNGIYIKAIGGKQRVYWNCYDEHAVWGWNYGQGAVMGGDLELNIDQWVPRMQEVGAQLMIGGSYVSKFEPMDTVYYTVTPPTIYNFPEWVGAGDVRAKFMMKGWNVLAEYAYKANDPSLDNNYSYDKGDALLLSLSYSKSGMSVLLQAKRSDNMAFRSSRSLRGTAGFINHLPAFTFEHTYALAALYPYATQVDGEWAFSGDLRYTWKRKTKMGGKYGTTLKLNFSHIRGLNREKGWFGMGPESYYTDVNLELNKKLSKAWYLNAVLMYQGYNQQVVEKHGEPMIHSGIAIADVKWNTSKNVVMRAELQYLFTKQAEGQWIYGLYELSLWKQLVFAVSDMYNIGYAPEATNHHYYNASVTYLKGAHRLSAGFARTRAGYNCTGGVCRYVPAQKGFTISYNYTW